MKKLIVAVLVIALGSLYAEECEEFTWAKFESLIAAQTGKTPYELIEKYNIQYWAIPKNGDLYKYLTQNSKAKVLTEDSNFAFLRTGGGEND